MILHQWYFNKKTVVVKGLEDGVQLVNRPVIGAYSGMVVKSVAAEKENTNQKSKRIIVKKGNIILHKIPSIRKYCHHCIRCNGIFGIFQIKIFVFSSS